MQGFNIIGKYATAKVTTDNIEETAIAQITELVNHPAAMNSKIVIMPDCHAGAGCVVGTTMTITDRVVPNLVGVDIGCGVSMYKVPVDTVDLKKFDQVIHTTVPAGFDRHAQAIVNLTPQDYRVFAKITNAQRTIIAQSLGTLGGGNHYCELDTDGKSIYFVVHSGSRKFGLLLAEWYQNIASSGNKHRLDLQSKSLIKDLTDKGQTFEIEAALKTLKAEQATITSTNDALAFLENGLMKEYLHDMMVAQRYASDNRDLIAQRVFAAMGWGAISGNGFIESVHNYIGKSPDSSTFVLRKGAVDATQPHFIVPLNMRDGILVLKGRENADWNWSAPHGAGRTMSRSQARQQLSMDDYKRSMQQVYSSSVTQSTLDEAPAAYKPAQEIKDLLCEQYELVAHMWPIYNFKASDYREKPPTETWNIL